MSSIDEIQARLTAGADWNHEPWAAAGEFDDWSHSVVDANGLTVMVTNEKGVAEFVANAPQDMRALLAENARLQAELIELRKENDDSTAIDAKA
jgi:hypothetical protein